MLDITKNKFKDKKYENVLHVLSDMSHLPIHSQSFDCVTLMYSLGHIQNRNPFYSELRRILKNKGICIIVVDGMWVNITKKLSSSKLKDIRIMWKGEGYDKINFEKTNGKTFKIYVHHFTCRELIKELKLSGFEIVDILGIAVPLSFVPYGLLKKLNNHSLFNNSVIYWLDRQLRRNKLFMNYSKHFICIAKRSI